MVVRARVTVIHQYSCTGSSKPASSLLLLPSSSLCFLSQLGSLSCIRQLDFCGLWPTVARRICPCPKIRRFGKLMNNLSINLLTWRTIPRDSWNFVYAHVTIIFTSSTPGYNNVVPNDHVTVVLQSCGTTTCRKFSFVTWSDVTLTWDSVLSAHYPRHVTILGKTCSWLPVREKT